MLPEHRRILRDLKRSRARQVAKEHRTQLAAAKAEAKQFRGIWRQAKRDGRRLLGFVDRYRRERPA